MKPRFQRGVATLRAAPSGQAGRALGDTTTLADPTVVEALKARYAEDSE